MPAALLLHGQPGSPKQWDGVAAGLRGRSIEVLAPDRPGYGASSLPAGGFRHNARAMLDLLDREGIGDAVVVGYSWSAGVAVAMSGASAVSALVLVCPVVPGGQPEGLRSSARAILSGRSVWIEQRALGRELPSLGAPSEPCTVVLAADDDVCDPAAGRRYAERIGARLVEVPDAGHLLPIERPEEVARAVAAATSESRGAR